MKISLIFLIFCYLSFETIDARCPTVKWDTDHERWIFPRRDVGPKYKLTEQMSKLNKHVREMSDKFMELYKKITAKSVDISKIPLKIYNDANKAVQTLYHEVVDEKFLDLTEPVYHLFNITRKIADEVSNATMYSLLQYKKFGKFIKDHMEYERTWFENAFGDLFEEIENAVEPFVASEKMECGSYAFTAGFQIGNKLYNEYKRCASKEINKTDSGINKFLLEMTDFEKEIHEGLYVAGKKCVKERLKHDPVACLENLLKMDLGKLINKEEVKEAAKKARKTSVKRVNTCASKATKKSLLEIQKVYQKFMLCFMSVKKDTTTSIEGINKFFLYFSENEGPHVTCPVIHSCEFKPSEEVSQCKA